MFINKKKAHPAHFFVSIGAGHNQIPLIKEAKELGFHVIGVDQNISAPGFPLCDLKIQESIDNHGLIYKMLLELLVDGEIKGVCTRSYGTALVTTSYLAERFNIPFLPYTASHSFANKRRMKAALLKHGIPTPSVIHAVSESKIAKLSPASFPVIVKPAIGHAKTNVVLAADPDEVLACLKSFENQEEVLIEKFIDGEEIIVVGVIHQGTYHLVEMTDKTTLFPPSFIDVAHVTPSKHIGFAKKASDIAQKIAQAFGIATAPLVMECVITPDGELYLIEAVPEFGGEFLADVLIPASCNYRIIRQVIRSMTGLGFTPPPARKGRKAVAVRYIIGSKGTLVSFNPEGPYRVKGTIFARIFKEIGSPVREPVTNHDRIGVVVVQADSAEDALEISKEAAAGFNLRIK